MLQNRWKSADVTLWKGISKEVRKFTPNRVTVANMFTSLQRNRQLRKVHCTGNNNCGFVFHFQILFETFLISYSTPCLQTRTQFLLFSIIWSPITCDHKSEVRQSTGNCAGVVFTFPVCCYCLFITVRITMSLWSFW